MCGKGSVQPLREAENEETWGCHEGSAPKARTISAWGNAPGDEKNRGMWGGFSTRPGGLESRRTCFLVRRTIPMGLIYGAGFQPLMIPVNLPPGALPQDRHR